MRLDDVPGKGRRRGKDDRVSEAPGVPFVLLPGAMRALASGTLSLCLGFPCPAIADSHDSSPAAGSGAPASPATEIVRTPAESLRYARFLEEGRSREPKLAEAIRHYEIAARSGLADAQLALGLLLTGADPAVARDAAASAEWFRLAAKQDDDEAQYFLGLVHELGEGIDASPGLAFEWYRRSASQGHARAMLGLARISAQGEGPMRDLAKAHAWNQLAATQGEEEGRLRARELAGRMSAEELARADGLAKALHERYGGGDPLPEAR